MASWLFLTVLTVPVTRDRSFTKKFNLIGSTKSQTDSCTVMAFSLKNPFFSPKHLEGP